ncbi:hypothetical protein [Oscillatoria sp. HE19RPO]|uniref:hypothetical protein n=1 Tax=Oscillatoria sp. HE19RPO TaxID=2954806 RepID=UPI0020C589E3|nr:hypothetical protein [Oscillatoria sp. HE19RPO]
MVTEIRLYIEGGENTKNTKALLRNGFSQFFQGFIKKARDRHKCQTLIEEIDKLI